MRMSASWFGSWTHRIQGRGAIDPRPESGLPSDRHPDRTKRAVVLEAVKVWPGKGGVRRKVGASANLDSSCARRLCNIAGRGEETELQVEQRNRSRQCAPLKNRLTKKAPYKGGLHRCAGLRRRQENQGQEAACSRRYIRPAASRCCPSCQRPRSRWSHSRHGDPVRDVSLSSKAVR